MAFAKDYVDVATRIRDFKHAYPDGSLQQVRLEFHEIAGQQFVLYVAACFRTPDDLRPGIGTAWEPIPGRTPYTKDSEVMVAETSAWGRAIVAATGADTKNGGPIASNDEVKARQTPPTPVTKDWLREANECSFRADLPGLRAVYGQAVKNAASAEILDAIKRLGDELAESKSV
jgi:hypothetical protein